MNCEDARRLIYLYEESSVVELAELESHLAGCTSCNALLLEVQQQKALVKHQLANVSPEFPHALTNLIMSAIEKRPVTWADKLSILVESMWLRPSMVAASLLLIMIFVLEHARVGNETRVTNVEAGVVLDSQRTLGSLKVTDGKVSYFSYIKEIKSR